MKTWLLGVLLGASPAWAGKAKELATARSVAQEALDAVGADDPLALGALLHPDDRATIEQAVATAVERGLPLPIEVEDLTRDQAVGVVAALALALRASSGPPVELVLVGAMKADDGRVFALYEERPERGTARVGVLPLRRTEDGWGVGVFGPLDAALGQILRANASAPAGPPDYTGDDGVPRVFVAHRVEPGAVLMPEDLVVARVAPDFADGAVVGVPDAVGRTAREVLLPGEPLREARLADRDVGLGVQALVPRGLRAVTVHAHAGGLARMDRVDVVAVRDAGACTLVQAATVLELGGRGQVTLALTPALAEAVTEAGHTGELFLTTRGAPDVAHVEAVECP